MAKCMFFVVVKSNALCSSGVVGIFFSGGGTVYDKKKGKKGIPCSFAHAHARTFRRSVVSCQIWKLELISIVKINMPLSHYPTYENNSPTNRTRPTLMSLSTH